MQPLQQFSEVVVRPEVHEKQTRLIIEHVIVQRGHFDPMLAQFAENRVDLGRGENEIAGNGGLALACRLEVHRYGGAKSQEPRAQAFRFR